MQCFKMWKPNGNIFCYNLDSKDIVHFISLHESFPWGNAFRGIGATPRNDRAIYTHYCKLNVQGEG